MKPEFPGNRDFWAGVFLIAVGASAIFIARNYGFGSTRLMGPGYFPTVLGGILVLFGLYVMVLGLRNGERFKGKWPLRPLIVLSASVVLFGVLMNTAGLIPALVILIIGSAAAGKEFRTVEVLLLTVFLTAFSVAVFLWGLRLPFPLIKGF
jgi:NADH:ubiquinone oxidoreductase subunit 6 (subunit J)